VTSPFHDGERAVQERVGVRERIEKMGQRMVRDFMPDEHREFFEDLPFVIAASADPDGALWASLLVGEPGFARSPAPRRLQVRATPLPDDPMTRNPAPGAPLGLLGIELATLRRNRVNGLVARREGDLFELAVDQSFGNCKQYIQARAGGFTPPDQRTPPSLEGALLSAEAEQLLTRTDTAFIATGSRDAAHGGAEGLDASHRGGLPGFIRTEAVGGATRLTLPDYYGNFMFNSFGNLELNPRAGLLALDFATGGVLSLTGTARVIWDGAAVAQVEGAERLLQFDVQRGRLWHDVLRGWSAPEWSRQLLGG